MNIVDEGSKQNTARENEEDVLNKKEEEKE
jgi:hypothetical protein